MCYNGNVYKWFSYSVSVTNNIQYYVILSFQKTVISCYTEDVFRNKDVLLQCDRQLEE